MTLCKLLLVLNMLINPLIHMNIEYTLIYRYTHAHTNPNSFYVYISPLLAPSTNTQANMCAKQTLMAFTTSSWKLLAATCL